MPTLAAERRRVRVQRGAEFGIGRQGSVVERGDEAVVEALGQVAHVAVPAMHGEHCGLATARRREERGAAEHFSPV